MLITTDVKVKDKIHDITRELATLDSDVQAEFFNKFFGALYAQCEGNHHYQLRMIVQSLSDDAKYYIGEMHEARA